MSSLGVEAITPEMERATNFCKYILPEFETGRVNPLRALENGSANCAARAFVIASAIDVIAGEANEVGFFIDRNHGRDMEGKPTKYRGHAMVFYKGSVIDTNDNPEIIKIGPIKSDDTDFDDGLVIYGDPRVGLLSYVQAHPGLEEVSEADIVEAKKQIQAML